MTATTYEHDTDRRDTFARLKRRRRYVRLLRVVVPAVGLLALAALAGQIYLASIGGGLSLSGVRIDRDRLVVDRPSLSGTLSGNGRYELVAETAETPLANAKSALLSAIEVTMLFDDGESARAVAEGGEIVFASRQLTTDHVITVTTSRGDRGEFNGGVIDLIGQDFSGPGGVQMRFANGSTLTASAMQYDATAGTWRFENVALSVVPPPATVSPAADQ